MSFFKSSWIALRSLFRNSAAEDELEEEMRFHIEMETRQNIKQGMEPAEARKAALKAFGGAERHKESCRDAWGMRVFSDLIQDLRYAWRRIRQNKLFSTLIVATLALCIGANTAMFSYLHAMLIKPYIYEDPDRVVNIGMRYSKSYGGMITNISTRAYLDIAESATSYEHIGFYDSNQAIDIHSDKASLREQYGMITEGVLPALGVRPLIGRWFTEEDVTERDGKVVLLSYELWQTIYGNDSSAVGSKLALDDETYEVIGVMPKGFSTVFNLIKLWIPKKVFLPWERSENGYNNEAYYAFGKLKQDVSLGQAQEELHILHQRYLDAHPDEQESAHNWGRSYAVCLANDLISQQVSVLKPMFFSMQASVAFVLAIGCLNISGLLLTRSFTRKSELSMRHSLGARKGRLLRQLTTEALLLFVLGGALSLAVAKGGIIGLNYIGFSEAPIGQKPGLNTEVLVLTLLSSIGCGIAFSILPSCSGLKKVCGGQIQSSRTVSSSVSKHWIYNSFVISQVALSLLLAVGAGVLVLDTKEIIEKDYGFATTNRIALSVDFPEYRYGPKSEKVVPFANRAIDAIKALPGVENASYANRVPLWWDEQNQSGFRVIGYERGEGERNPQGVRYVTHKDFFDAMGIRLLEGRVFSDLDSRDSEKVAIVDAYLARKYFPGRSAIGGQIRAWGQVRTIVGIVADTVDKPFHQPDVAHKIYLPQAQYGPYDYHKVFIVHSKGNAETIINSVRKALLKLDPQLAGMEILTMKKNLQRAMLLQDMPMKLISAMGILALLLCALGIYGIMAYSVGERKREIGIRIAIGASASSVLKKILFGGLTLASVGLAIGLTISYFAMGAIGGLLREADARDPRIFIAASMCIILATLIACWLPARRATVIDPNATLRCE